MHFRVLQAMFKKASAYKHSVFFIDDVEVLGEQGEGPAELSARVKTELKSQLQNMRTNCPECKPRCCFCRVISDLMKEILCWLTMRVHIFGYILHFFHDVLSI